MNPSSPFTYYRRHKGQMLLLLILISLVPVQALDNLFQGMVAIFVGARAIFFRRYVLGPGLKLTAVLLVLSIQGSVQLLAACYLVAGILIINRPVTAAAVITLVLGMVLIIRGAMHIGLSLDLKPEL